MQFLQYEGQNHNFSVGCYQLLQSSLPRQLLELVQQKPIGTFKFKFWWYTHLTESEPGNYQYFITERFYKKRGIGLCYSWKRSTEAGNIGSHFSKKKRIQKKKKICVDSVQGFIFSSTTWLCWWLLTFGIVADAGLEGQASNPTAYMLLGTRSTMQDGCEHLVHSES